MGGAIGVRSTVGLGSTFWFELALKPAHAEDVSAHAHGVPVARVRQAVAALQDFGRPVKVLIAEDNATNRLVAQSVLARYGIFADLATNGIEAIDAVKAGAYDVVFMDVQMPEMDGLEATRAIRMLPAPRRDTPIIALTANVFADDIEKCMAAGMNACLAKPFRREDLLVTLVDVIQGTWRRQESAPASIEQSQAAPDVDWETLAKFREDAGDDLFHLLIDTFLSDTVLKLQTLADLARDGTSVDDAARIAHSLKSAGALAGAAALSRAAARAEASIGHTKTFEPREAEELSTLFAAYKAALESRSFIAA
jgi:CheY-like chemotaxis protein